jgi:hypothetical protein
LWPGGLALVVATSALTSVLACDGHRVVSSERPGIALTVQVAPSADLAAAVQALGWPATGIPGASVIAEQLTADAENGPPADTAVADSSGLARFENLPVGRYQLRASRAFTVAELVRADRALGNVDGLEGLATVQLSPSNPAPLRVEVRGTGGSTLVISEVTAAHPLQADGTYDNYAGFVEIYNNTDGIIPLAGKLFFDAFSGDLVEPSRACDTYAAFMRDPDGLWTNFIWQFPPSARPLGPGEAAVIATDAIDHRRFGSSPAFMDLSHADFEFRGGTDVDNPLVPDMISVGLRDGGLDGHGWRSWAIREVIGLAENVGLDTLPTRTDPRLLGTNIFVRIPRAALLDVLLWENKSSVFIDCPGTSVAQNIDAGEARLLDYADVRTLHRKLSRITPSGRVVLQRSRNSAADFFAALPNPWTAP